MVFFFGNSLRRYHSGEKTDRTRQKWGVHLLIQCDKMDVEALK